MLTQAWGVDTLRGHAIPLLRANALRSAQARTCIQKNSGPLCFMSSFPFFLLYFICRFWFFRCWLTLTALLCNDELRCMMRKTRRGRPTAIVDSRLRSYLVENDEGTQAVCLSKFSKRRRLAAEGDSGVHVPTCGHCRELILSAAQFRRHWAHCYFLVAIGELRVTCLDPWASTAQHACTQGSLFCSCSCKHARGG